jgi:ABC-2 type transport system ATP-binding protein
MRAGMLESYELRSCTRKRYTPLMPTPALSINAISKTYPGKNDTSVHALDEVTLTVPQGEFFALLGPNGAGKTTLISILSGLVNKTSGTAQVCGIDIDRHPDRAKSNIGLVPQELNFNIFEKVIDIIIDQAGYYGIPRHQALPEADRLLKELGLWEKRDMKAETLSGGMKRRLMIARALVHGPKVLLLDEPTAGVDVELRRSMWDFLRALNQSGTTIILTTHYLEEAEQLCRRVAVINGGKIIEEGSVKGLLTKLKSTTLHLDTVEQLTEAAMQLLRGQPMERIDDHTLKLTLKSGETVNESFRKLSSVGIHVENIRSTGSRLEEVFLQLVEKP